jgi:biotin synthase
LLVPKANIGCAAGREIYLGEKQNLMFYAVDSIFAAGYLTTGGQSIKEVIELIRNAGFEYEIE